MCIYIKIKNKDMYLYKIYKSIFICLYIYVHLYIYIYLYIYISILYIYILLDIYFLTSLLARIIICIHYISI